MATAKVRIAARLRPRLAHETPDPGDPRVCHAEPANTSTSSDPGKGKGSANTSLTANSSANASGSSNNGSGTFTGIAVANPRDASQIFRFPFTSCYDADATQAAIFDADVRPLVDVALSGVTVTIFAYGVTSSGKTYTMQGPRDDPGVIPRVVETLFAKTTATSGTTEKTDIAVSYMEIYKDDVYDLLVERENGRKLPIRENDVGAVFVAGLSSVPIDSVATFDKHYTTATARRSVGATLLNDKSSRSHSVLTLNLRVRAGDKVREGKINLVDLAGSENNKLTGNDPSRMAESAAINKSLSVLGQVVHALNTGAPRIPYRNAKLTRILQDALGGASVGLLICNLSPASKFRQDTLNTLNFAVRTKNIENKPVVNERDIRPPPPPKIDLALVPPAPAPKPRESLAIRPGVSARPSLVPRPASRTSTFGLGLGGVGAPFSRVSSISATGVPVKEKEAAPPGLTEAEIDARISRAVEAEVARRLEEREREKEREAEMAAAAQAGSSRAKSPKPRKDRDGSSRSPKAKGRELPPGLTPLLKRHKDLDNELQARLQELERKFSLGNKETALADVLSPVSKKKTGRAYVALARAHSEKGDLQVALELYRRAETYVPDNVKLKERIIEIEWAVKNDRAFKPSPKRTKTKKGGKTKARAEEVGEMDVDAAAGHDGENNDDKKREQEQPLSDDQMEVDEVESSLTGPAAFGFGAELTNTGSKRSLVDAGMDTQTPAKRPKRRAAEKNKMRVVAIESDEEDEYGPAAAPRKSRRRIAAT
ncbi:kinesin-like protein [Mycena alexandri]|uniref:Kinesin-like protein n=1 Tax=Mycena alexandri TaxID=1745969 RepID=A0AAD6WQG6_9AGAR|nr:kinesin-like protein [Mycena alexandri]